MAVHQISNIGPGTIIVTDSRGFANMVSPGAFIICHPMAVRLPEKAAHFTCEEYTGPLLPIEDL